MNELIHIYCPDCRGKFDIDRSDVIEDEIIECDLCGAEVVITNEQVTRHKPDPEAYLLTLEKLSVPSSDVLVFEDSKSGLIAATKANCDVVAFRHEFNVNNDFSLAIQVISDFNEFLVGEFM